MAGFVLGIDQGTSGSRALVLDAGGAVRGYGYRSARSPRSGCTTTAAATRKARARTGGKATRAASSRCRAVTGAATPACTEGGAA